MSVVLSPQFLLVRMSELHGSPLGVMIKDAFLSFLKLAKHFHLSSCQPKQSQADWSVFL